MSRNVQHRQTSFSSVCIADSALERNRSVCCRGKSLVETLHSVCVLACVCVCLCMWVHVQVNMCIAGSVLFDVECVQRRLVTCHVPIKHLVLLIWSTHTEGLSVRVCVSVSLCLS